MGLLVDKPKPGGSGTSNGGNAARRFFQNSPKSAEILGIKESLIQRCAVMLQVLSSGHEINTGEFDKYARETAKLLVAEFPWFYLPASIHKILIHGADVVSAAILPIGQLSEEAQEARNKDLKSIRERHSRTISRVKTNEDLNRQFLVTSDPHITNLRLLPKKKETKMNYEVRLLLEGITPNLENSGDDSTSDSEEENVS